MKHFTRLALAAGCISLSSLSFAAATNNNMAINPAEKAKIEAVVHEYLINNPQVLLEVMQILQRKQAEQAQQTVQQTQKVAASFANALFHQPNDPIAGNSAGNVTVVEFFDYQCPHCVDMAPIMSAVIKANPNVRVVYKEFPIRGPVSEFASRAALAANLQGKYDTFSHALLTAGKQLNQDTILEIAKNTGLDVNKLKTDMDSSAVKNQLQANIKLAQDLKLFGTPALFIGKTTATGNQPINYLPGEADQSQLQSMIDQAK